MTAGLNGSAATLPPTTRYQGSKRKLLRWIDEQLADIPFSSLLDLMSGTASVAYYFKSRGLTVASNDYLRCNYLTAIALVENSAVTLSPADVDFIVAEPASDDYTFIRDHFRGFFYADDENVWLDHRIARIHGLADKYEGNTLKYKQALSYHALFQASLMKRPFNLFHRKNLYLRQNDSQRSFGNKTTWDTPFEVLFRRLCDETNDAVFSNGCENVAYNSTAEDLSINQAFDLIYIDPPYFATGRERARSDYRFLYHFLEGMAHYDDWSNLYDPNDARHALKRDYSDSQPLGAPASELEDNLIDWLRRILTPWADSIIVMSYKSPGIPTVEQLRSLLLEFKSNVDIHERPYTYALSKRNGQPGHNIELLLVGR